MVKKRLGIATRVGEGVAAPLVLKSPRRTDFDDVHQIFWLLSGLTAKVESYLIIKVAVP